MRSALLRNLFLLLWIIPAACADHDEATIESDVKAALFKASLYCHGSVAEMSWLGDLIRNSLTDPDKTGNFYAIHTANGVVIVHQPLIMSCAACIQYDCHGNRLNDRDLGVALQMSDITQIYPPL